jgi:methionine-rich copper-binding protein CopC
MRTPFLAALVLLALAGPARAEPMQVLEVRPAARSVMDGNRQEVFVRFDRPVDHYTSRLELLQDGRVLRTLVPRLGTAPEVLFAIAGELQPGAYTLRWVARSPRDGTEAEGTLDFSVR